MNFKQWLEAQYQLPAKDFANIEPEISPQQFQFDRLMLKKKFAPLQAKFRNLTFDYEEKDDTLTVFGGLVQDVVYVGDQQYQFPLEVAQKVVDKYFTKHTVGLAFVGDYGVNVRASQQEPLVPEIMDIGSGEYNLCLSFHNVSQYQPNDLEKRIGGFYQALERAQNELENYLGRFEQN